MIERLNEMVGHVVEGCPILKHSDEPLENTITLSIPYAGMKIGWKEIRDITRTAEIAVFKALNTVFDKIVPEQYETLRKRLLSAQDAVFLPRNLFHSTLHNNGNEIYVTGLCFVRDGVYYVSTERPFISTLEQVDMCLYVDEITLDRNKGNMNVVVSYNLEYSNYTKLTKDETSNG